MKKPIVCYRCKEEIKSKKDIVITSFLFKFILYHNKCYNEAFESAKTIYVGSPINKFIGNIGVLATLILAIALVFSETYRLLSIALIIPPLVRLFVWLRYERFLD